MRYFLLTVRTTSNGYTNMTMECHTFPSLQYIKEFYDKKYTHITFVIMNIFEFKDEADYRSYSGLN